MVAFRWKEGVTQSDVGRLCEELGAFRQKVECLVDYRFGPDLGLRDGNADFGVAAVVETPAGLAEYLDHRAHKQLFSDFIAPIMASRTAVQIETDRPPGSGEEGRST
jgi:Stress responsive A/B Barrel Domain